MDDLISKQDALDAIARVGLLKSDTKEVQAVAECLRKVEKLPSVNPQPCEDAISRQAVLDGLASIAKIKAKSDAQKSLMGRVMFFTEQLPSVNPQPKTGYISIDDVMSVFDDYMLGEVDEDGTDTFLKMLKDRAESEE